MVKKSARRTRRTHILAFKARVALAALREGVMMAELCQAFELPPDQITELKRQLLDGATDVFGEGGQTPVGQISAQVNLAPMDAMIGQLALENEFLERALSKGGLLSAKP